MTPRWPLFLLFHLAGMVLFTATVLPLVPGLPAGTTGVVRTVGWVLNGVVFLDRMRDFKTLTHFDEFQRFWLPQEQ